MLFYDNNSKNVIVILHEIYGINKHIKNVCKKYSDLGFDVLCPNLLLDRKTFDYADEEIAYKNFKNNIGFEVASNKVKKLLTDISEKYESIITIGFSVGATIAWICSEVEDVCNGIICYYGSRIRDYIDVLPKCPIVLLYPKEEKSFDIDNHIKEIEVCENMAIHVLEGKHGFADEYCKNYNDNLKKEAEELTLTFIQKIIGEVNDIPFSSLQ